MNVTPVVRTILVALVLVAGTHAETVDALLRQAAQRYRAEDDIGALTALHQAREIAPEQLEARWREAYMMLVIANRRTDRKERSSWLKQAQPKVDSLLRDQPGSADAWFVGALSLGVESTLASPRRRVELSKEMHRRIERCLARDSGHPGGWFLLGRWHEGFATLNPVERGMVDLLLGGMPAGASLDSSRIALSRAATLRPQDLQIHLDLVRVLLRMACRDQAKTVATQALAFPVYSEGDRENLRSLKGLLRDL